MKKLLLLLLVLSSCSRELPFTREKIDISGEWEFSTDPGDNGINDKWSVKNLPGKIKLPGSMAENGMGDEVTVSTDWTGDIIDRSYFEEDKYKKYREKGNVKVPFWLQPVRYYKGVAWYARELAIPENWLDKRVYLHLERCHWQSVVYMNGDSVASGASLSIPHEFEITKFLKKGSNRLAIRIDNRVVIPIGVNSHSISDHTQSNWNGITGSMYVEARPTAFIKEVRIYPDLEKKIARVHVLLSNTQGSDFSGSVRLKANRFDTGRQERNRVINIEVNSSSGLVDLVAEYPMGRHYSEWTEFDPALYSLSATLEDKGGKVIDSKDQIFGMREFRTSGTHFTVNGDPVFLRGTLECCIFPLTGYPPTDLASWEKVMTTIKSYGLNTVRFHSWCPPEAAFVAGDKLGMFFQIECSSWANQGTTIGDGRTVDRFIYDEGNAILSEYGNHPSFCMLAYGNEPAGKHQNEYLGKLINYWKSIDNRRVYTSAAGWPIIPENEYNLTSEPRIQHWGEGLKSIINNSPPQTAYDFRDFVSRYTVPTVSHEIGQWCVYPDFSEIDKYTGVLKARNFEIFRESLAEKGMGDQAELFLKASGKLQVLCYKADIEAALRTPGFAGFHLLQLHDFPGQGSALVGILNPFFESKGYVTPSEFTMFCNQTVPLARMGKLIYRSSETFNAKLEISHWGNAPLEKATLLAVMKTAGGKVLKRDSSVLQVVPVGNCFDAGTFSMPLDAVTGPVKCVFELSLKGTAFRNNWEVWVYPEKQDNNPRNVIVTDRLDKKTLDVLSSGGKVLYLTYGKIGPGHGAKVEIGFSSIFWNTAWTGNQAPHTLGIVCDPSNPAFKLYPTEFHSNWQWWDPVTHSQAMILDAFPQELKPLVQPVDTWFENRRLALAFEGRVGKGSLLVCSIDMVNDMRNRPSTAQLLESFLAYMNSVEFHPDVPIDPLAINKLLE
ncbi:MAG: beta-galactosidase [Bacteroidales bacterium]